MGRSPEMWACKLLRTKYFHGVSSGYQHPYLLKSRYRKVSLFLSQRRTNSLREWRFSMFRAFFQSKEWRYRAYGGSAAIVGFLIAQLKVALTINVMNKRFYDVWSDPGHHYLSEVYIVLLPFLVMGFLLVFVNTIASYITSKFVLWWREAVTFSYLDLARSAHA